MPQKWGLWLAIEGDLRFLSHRDCARLIERAAVRAQLPLKYTQGFNPRPVLALVCPRPVGVASRDDLAVLWLTEALGEEDLVRRLARQLPRGLTILRAQRLEGRRSPQPRRIRYEWPVPPGRAEPLRSAVEAFGQAPSRPVARRKPDARGRPGGPARTIDLKPLVERIELDGDVLRWSLVPHGQAWAKPAEVLQAVGLDGPADLAAAVRAGVEYDL